MALSPLFSPEGEETIYPLVAFKVINGWYIEVRIPAAPSSYLIASLFTAEWGNKNFMIPRVEGVTEEVLIENVWDNVVRFQIGQAEDQVIEFLHRGGRLS